MSELADFIETPVETQEPEAETPAPEIQAEPPAAEAQEADGEGTPAQDDPPPKAADDAPEGAPTAPDNKEPDSIPIAALLDERGKRQAVERELEQLRSQMSQAEQTPAPDVFEDPDGYRKHMQDEAELREWNLRCDLTSDMMRSIHDDYDDMEARFIEMGKENSELLLRMRQSSNPAKFAYDTAKKAIRFEAMENVDEWEAKKTAEIEAKLKAEFEQKANERATKADSLPPSLTAATAVGGNTAVISVPDPLETTFNR